MFLQIKQRSLLYRLWFYLERRVKELLFDCHMCGQCVLRSTALTCPMTCPKQLRNGPCGGSYDGRCEVYPDRSCIWTQAYERADRHPWLKQRLRLIQPAIDWALFGSSAWLNIWPEHKTDLAGHAFSPAPAPAENLWEERPMPQPCPEPWLAVCNDPQCKCRVIEKLGSEK